MMQKYEKPVMEVMTIMEDAVFTLVTSNGDGKVEGDGDW